MSRREGARDDGRIAIVCEVTMKPSSLAAFCAPLMACACGSLPHEEWENRPSHPALPTAFLVVDSDGIAANCGTYPQLYVFGCAKRLFESQACLVFTRANPASWLIEHEQKHCDGWDHVAVSRELPAGMALFAVPAADRGGQSSRASARTAR